MWAFRDGEPQSGRGITRDINTLGVFVLTDALPPVGARVQMEIALPKLTATGMGMQLTCEGVVLRCESGDATKRGFAASAQFYPDSAAMMLATWNVTAKKV
jgi:hypothetical protein